MAGKSNEGALGGADEAQNGKETGGDDSHGPRNQREPEAQAVVNHTSTQWRREACTSFHAATLGCKTERAVKIDEEVIELAGQDELREGDVESQAYPDVRKQRDHADRTAADVARARRKPATTGVPKTAVPRKTPIPMTKDASYPRSPTSKAYAMRSAVAIAMVKASSRRGGRVQA